MNDRQANAARRVRWTGRIGAATLALAASASAVSAQYYEMQIERPRVYDAPRVYEGWDSAPRVYRMEPAPVSPGRAVGALLARNGYRAAGPAVRNGDVFIVPAEDRRGRRFRMVIDIYAGEILERFAMTGPNREPRPPAAVGRAPAAGDEFAPVGRNATRDLRAPETRGLGGGESVAGRPPLPDDARLAPGAGSALAPGEDEAPRAAPRRAESKPKPAAKPAPRQARNNPAAKPDAKPDAVEAARAEPPRGGATEMESGRTQAARTDAKQEPAKPQTAKAEPAAKPETAIKPDLAKPDVAKVEPAKQEPVKQELVKQEPVKPEPAKPALAKAEPTKPAARPATKPMANSSILRRPSAKADDAADGPKTQSAEAGETGTRRAPRVVYPGPGTSQATPAGQ